MKNKFVYILFAIIILVGAWGFIFLNQNSKAARISELRREIEENAEVRTYKNVIDAYKEIISLDPQNINWYVGLAEAYYSIEEYANYHRICEKIVDKFPDEKVGYLRLINYYDEIGKVKSVIDTYENLPESLKEDQEIKETYLKNEWEYRFLSSSFDSISVMSGNSYLVKNGGLYGFLSSDLDDDIKCKFELARPFIEDNAAVFKNDEWYFIDREGDRIMATKKKIEDLYSFSEGYAVAKLNGKYGYINSKFDEFSFDYDDATSFYNGVACVKKDGKWAIINRNFENVTGFEYEDVIRDEANICSRKGFLFLKKNGSYQLTSLKGEMVTNTNFEDAKLFYDELAAVKKDGKWGYIDQNGEIVIPCTYQNANTYSKGIATVCQGDSWGMIDKDGKQILEFVFQDASITSQNGIAVLKIGERFRFAQFIKFE